MQDLVFPSVIPPSREGWFRRDDGSDERDGQGGEKLSGVHAFSGELLRKKLGARDAAGWRKPLATIEAAENARSTIAELLVHRYSSDAGDDDWLLKSALRPKQIW
ncbi:hypothetical protein [Variovorax paradoxus]|uniref:hypothetical protein n=1 Tax=Variovorax paradoxus TaxID=34073 RepID=UPI002856BAEF|nr:hypothetical protein [Variovorax sp. 3319]